MARNKKTKSKIKIGEKLGSTKKYFYWVVVTILISLQVLLTVQTSTLGAEFKEIEKKQYMVNQENQSLLAELVDKTSLSILKEKTDVLGYLDPQHSLYINLDNFVAGAFNGSKN